jgi:NAD(P)-dependent dehydrogenase (short-subunit alcohol dehydrogenase family)
MSSLFDLSGQVAVVTGSSRGIGQAIAERLAESGARVIISSRHAEACEPVAQGIRDGGGEASVIACNIGVDEQLEALIDQTLEIYGRIDTLVCNAASNPVYGPMAEVDRSAFDKIMGNNVRSNFLLCNKVAPIMAGQGGGSLIIVSSICGVFGNKNLGVYGISKAADFQLARNLAVEWGPKRIRANCIAPGLVKTEFARALWENPKAIEYVNNMTPLGRMGDPDDIAGAAVYLASAAGQYMTGQNMVVDGGTTIRDTF